MGLRSSLIAVVFEEFDGVFDIDDDLAALLHHGWCQEGVFVSLRREMGAVEEFFDAFKAIDVAMAGCLGHLDGGFGLLRAAFAEQLFEVGNREGCDGCGVFNNHGGEGY